MKPLCFSALLVMTAALAVVPSVRAEEVAESSSRGTIVIVHGAWGAGYEWKDVGRGLRAKGFDVYRPTLTGMGERSHLANPDIDLETHIMDVMNTILFESLDDVILIGHSYGGMVITGVADRLPDRIKKLVYFDAFLPENGESADVAISGRERPATEDFVKPMWNVTPGPPPHAVPQPAKTLRQPLTLTQQDAVAKIPTIYILTVDPGATPEEDAFFRFYERARARGWKLIEMEANHVPQVTRVPEIVQLLAQEAGLASSPAMTSLSIYLLLDGNCAQAMRFYRDCLGGQLTMTTVGESPMKAFFPESMHGRVVNAKLTSPAITRFGAPRTCCGDGWWRRWAARRRE